MYRNKIYCNEYQPGKPGAHQGSFVSDGCGGRELTPKPCVRKNTKGKLTCLLPSSDDYYDKQYFNVLELTDCLNLKSHTDGWLKVENVMKAFIP